MQKETLCDIQLTSLTSLILLILSFLLFKIIDSVGKVLTKKREPTVFQNLLLSETTHGTIMDCHSSFSPTNLLAIINYYIDFFLVHFFLVQIEA